jgi:hypothetical protein
MRRPARKNVALAAAGLAAVGMVVAGCSSHSSSTGAASPDASSTGARRAVAACFRDHGADPSLLTGLLTGGSARLSSSQLSALRAAGTACAASVPASLNASLATVVTCLDGKGYHLDGHSPLAALASLDLTSAATDAAIKACTPGGVAPSPSPSAS